jgi:hypothetical protein
MIRTYHKRLIFCLSLVIVFLQIHQMADASGIEGKWNGQIRVQGSVAGYEKSHILDLTGDTGPFRDGALDARLNGTLFVGDRLTFETHYEAVLSGGQSREALGELTRLIPGGAPLMSGPPSDDRRLFSLTHVISDDENRLMYHRLDRLSATYTNDRITVRAGRQALTWGNGLVFNPMDLLNPFAPSDVIRDYKAGDDMLVLQGDYGPFSDLQLVYVPRRNPGTGNVSNSASSVAGKAQWTALESDWNLLFSSHYEDTVLGIGMVRYIKDAAWRTDLTYTAMDGDISDGYFSAVTNLDYSWVWGGYNFYGLGEVYYNGLGKTDPMDALRDGDLQTRITRGDLFTLGRWYATGQIQFEAHPLVNIFLSTIVNLNDPSMLLQPRITWDVLSSTRILAGLDIPVGAGGTEYGGPIHAPTGKQVGAPLKGYVIATWYF